VTSATTLDALTDHQWRDSTLGRLLGQLLALYTYPPQK
jgi:hypothetical protein